MKKFCAIVALAVVSGFAAEQQATAGNFRFSTGFYMEFGHGGHGGHGAPGGAGRLGRRRQQYYFIYPYSSAPMTMYGHAAPTQVAPQQPNWTPPTPTPENGNAWSYPHQPYGNIYQPAYWYGW